MTHELCNPIIDLLPATLSEQQPGGHNYWAQYYIILKVIKIPAIARFHHCICQEGQLETNPVSTFWAPREQAMVMVKEKHLIYSVFQQSKWYDHTTWI